MTQAAVGSDLPRVEDLTRDELIELVQHTYQFVGSLADEFGVHDRGDVQDCLDRLAYGRVVTQAEVGAVS